jgi:hypothetical protein
MPQMKEWTVMFYLASDNPLAPSVVSQLKAIKDAGYHPEANVVAHFDPHTRDTPTHVFDVNLVAKLKARGRSRVGHANNPFVRNLVLDKLWGDVREEDKSIRERIGQEIKASLTPKRNGQGSNGHVPVADAPGGVLTAEDAPAAEGEEVEFKLPVLPEGLSGERHPSESLKEFLRFCKEEYPARRYLLFLLGHGLVVGNRMFMLDENSGATPRRHPLPGAPTNGMPTNGAATNGAATNGAATNGRGSNGGGAPFGDAGEDFSPQSLTLKDLSDALDVFKPAAGERSRLELVGFHSCSMSGLEVAYELRGKANYMMASQGPAFVGSWPYRQILLRLFNDLNATLRASDLTDKPALLARLKAEADPVSKYLRGKLSDGAAGLVDGHDGSSAPAPATIKAVVAALNAALRDGGLSDEEVVGAVEKSEATRQLIGRSRSLRGANRRRLNRLLLADAYPGAIAPNPGTDDAYVKGLLTDVFYYVLYNSYDFQLAGYSFDLCLCDLNKVGELKTSVDRLAGALKRGLAGEGGLAGAEPLARELILLAHWDAQSFWQDSYTDLFDFCFRLKRRCLHVFPELAAPAPPGGAGDPLGVVREIAGACAEVMLVLEKGKERDDERVVVRAEFAGAEYQYSHGLSVYFPWSRPADGFFGKYQEYAFAAETSWDDFLDEYFTKTMRESQGQENPTTQSLGLEREVLESLLRTIGARAFPDGQLSKGAGNDATGGGKGGGGDASGDDCACHSVKNYPPFTGPRPAGPKAAKREAYSPAFFQRAKS